MRNRLALLSLSVFAGLALPAYAQAPWTLAAQTANDNYFVPVDSAKVTGTPELRRITVLIVKNTSTKYQQVASENDWEFNCSARTYRMAGRRAMGPDGKVFDSSWAPTDWLPLKQGAAITYTSGFACGDTKPLGPEFVSAEAAIARYWKETP